MGSQEIIRMKLFLDDEKRIIYRKMPVMLESLQNDLYEMYAKPVAMLYVDDDDGTEIRLSTQDELEEAIDHHEKRRNKTMNILLNEIPEPLSRTLDRPLSISKEKSYKTEFERHHLAEEEARREALGTPVTPRPSSPPPGFLHETPIRANSVPSKNSLNEEFRDVRGGGEFIPESSEPQTQLATLSLRSNGSYNSYGSYNSMSSHGSSSNGHRPPDEEAFLDGADDEDVPHTLPRLAPRADLPPGPSTYPRSKTKPRLSEHEVSVFSREESDNSSSSQPRAPKKWQRGALIGTGAFGQVYRALDMDTGNELAVKQVDLHMGDMKSHKKEIESLEEEILLLKNLKHERIVRYIGTLSDQAHLYIFMEYVSGRSVHSRLRDYGAFTEDVVRRYARQILEGLDYLHQHRIIHRDIKGANVLIDGNNNIKLADFGASKRLQNLTMTAGVKSIHGTPYWMSPEVIKGAGYGRRADIWSVGCTVVEMLTARPPFAELEPMAALFKIGDPNTDFNQVIPKDISPVALDFIQKCLDKNPNSRKGAHELLGHSFFF